MITYQNQSRHRFPLTTSSLLQHNSSPYLPDQALVSSSLSAGMTYFSSLLKFAHSSKPLHPSMHILFSVVLGRILQHPWFRDALCQKTKSSLVSCHLLVLAHSGLTAPLYTHVVSTLQSPQHHHSWAFQTCLFIWVISKLSIVTKNKSQE